MRRVIRNSVGLFAVAALATTLAGCSLLSGGSSYKVGDTVKGSTVSAKVTGVRFAREVTGFFPAVAQPAEGSLWAFVDMELTNTQTDALTEPYSAFGVTLVTEDGKKAADGPPIMANGPPDFHALGTIQSLDAGESAKGTAAFYVTEGATLGEVRLSDFGLDKKDVSVSLGGIKAEAPKAEVVALGKAADVGGVEVTIHGTRVKKKYSYKSGILTSSLTPGKGNEFLEIDMTISNVSIESSITVSDLFGNEIFSAEPDTPSASRIFVVDDKKNYAGPMGSIGLFREEMMPKPLWWNVKPLKVGESKRAWVVYNVPAAGTYHVMTRMPRLGPPVLFSLK
jgi:hypothetical protein